VSGSCRSRSLDLIAHGLRLESAGVTLSGPWLEQQTPSVSPAARNEVGGRRNWVRAGTSHAADRAASRRRLRCGCMRRHPKSSSFASAACSTGRPRRCWWTAWSASSSTPWTWSSIWTTSSSSPTARWRFCAGCTIGPSTSAAGSTSPPSIARSAARCTSRAWTGSCQWSLPRTSWWRTVRAWQPAGRIDAARVRGLSASFLSRRPTRCSPTLQLPSRRQLGSATVTFPGSAPLRPVIGVTVTVGSRDQASTPTSREASASRATASAA
jgi:hypothetical protein